MKRFRGNARGDVFGGITAGIVALPLALGFGVASGIENGAAHVLACAKAVLRGGNADVVRQLQAATARKLLTKSKLTPRICRHPPRPATRVVCGRAWTRIASAPGRCGRRMRASTAACARPNTSSWSESKRLKNPDHKLTGVERAALLSAAGVKGS